MNDTDYTLSVVDNATYVDYYVNMSIAETETQLESSSMDDVDLLGTFQGMLHANRSLHMGAGSIMASLSTLGLMTQGSGGAAQLLHDAMAASMIAMGVNSALRAAMNARKSWEQTQAAIDAAAAALAQNWYGLAIAGVAAAGVYEAFSAVERPSIVSTADISTAQGQRQVSQTMQAVANG